MDNLAKFYVITIELDLAFQAKFSKTNLCKLEEGFQERNYSSYEGACFLFLEHGY